MSDDRTFVMRCLRGRKQIPPGMYWIGKTIRLDREKPKASKKPMKSRGPS